MILNRARYASKGMRPGQRALFLLLLTAALIVSCSENLPTEELLPTLAPSAVPLANVPMSPTTADTPTERPTLPATSTPRQITETPAEKAKDTRERTPVAPASDTPLPTFAPPSTTPTLPQPTPTPTELPLSPPPSATVRSGPLPPDEPWPEPTQHPFPISNDPRHGVAAAFGAGEGAGVKAEEYAWTYSWTPYVPDGTSRIQHIPMLTGGPSNGIPSIETIADMDGRADHDYWLVFNECEQHWQCDTSPQDAAIFYHDVVVETMYGQGVDPDAKLIVGEVNSHTCGIQWLSEFVTHYEANYGPMPRAGWHFHIYPEIEPNTWPQNCSGQWDFDDTLYHSPDEAFNLWTDRAAGVLAFAQQYSRVEDEIWITEMGCLNYGFHQEQRPVCQEGRFIAAYVPKILSWLNNEGRWVTRYAWYTNWDTKFGNATKLFSSVEGPWKYSSLGWFFSQVIPASSSSLPIP
ncbi:MAG: glycosyl hydrolase [Candidatus Promineifilaceae bacterium]